MNRREFLSKSAGLPTVLLSTLEPWSEAGMHASEDVDQAHLAGLTLGKLREQYRHELFNEFLPFMEEHVIDRKYGGFMCNAGMDGTRADDNKRATYVGRGIWVYSFLYNHLAKEAKYVETARHSIEFLLRAKSAGEDALWPRDLTRDGQALSQGDIYGDLFIAEGLVEYSIASGDSKYWDLAKEIVFKCIRIYDRADHRPEIGQSYLGSQAPPFPGARVQGTWMLLLRIATQMLSQRPDRALEQVAARCVEAVRKYHYNPELRLNNELLNHDLSRPTNEYRQLVYTGHAFETIWMILAEALRRHDDALFSEQADRFKRHVDISWDHIYGGVFQNLRNAEQNVWALDKELWPQEEVLIGCMLLVEHAGDQWASEMFSRMFAYVEEKFPLRRYGWPLWIHASDRKVTFEAYAKQPKRTENYHHPRYLMLNLLSVERMIQQHGERSPLNAPAAAAVPIRLR